MFPFEADDVHNYGMSIRRLSFKNASRMLLNLGKQRYLLKGQLPFPFAVSIKVFPNDTTQLNIPLSFRFAFPRDRSIKE